MEATSSCRVDIRHWSRILRQEKYTGNIEGTTETRIPSQRFQDSSLHDIIRTIHTRVQRTIFSVPRERVEGPSMTASVDGDSDGSWGGISPVAVMSVFANRQSGVRGVLFPRKRKYLALGMIGDRTEYVFVAPRHVEALMKKSFLR